MKTRFTPYRHGGARRLRPVLLPLVALLLLVPAALAQGDEYDLSWWTVDSGGYTWSTGGEYGLGATIGQPDAATLAGGEYGLQAGFWDSIPALFLAYIPRVGRNELGAPDLVVLRIIATSDNVQVVLLNQGNAAVWAQDEFWVDFYVDPDPPPTGVNQTWDQLCNQGLVWGVTAPALPLLPGGVITLTANGDYFWPEHSYVVWPLAVGTPVYAQVDSANVYTDYGAVRELHEIRGEPYNNILGPVYVEIGAGATPPAGAGRSPDTGGHLPPRP